MLSYIGCIFRPYEMHFDDNALRPCSHGSLAQCPQIFSPHNLPDSQRVDQFSLFFSKNLAPTRLFYGEIAFCKVLLAQGSFHSIQGLSECSNFLKILRIECCHTDN